MHRTLLFLPAIALPWLFVACTNAGQNGLESEPDGYIPIPFYEASPPPSVDGSFETGDGPDGRSDGSADGAKEASAETGGEAAQDAPTTDGPADASHDGAGPG